MKKLQIIYISILAVLMFSCDDYLDEPNQNGPTLVEAVNNLDDTNKLLNGVYNSLFNHYVLSLQEDGYRSDEGSVTNRLNSSTTRVDQIEYYNNSYNSNTRGLGQRWGALYSGIFFANQTLFGLDKIKPTLTSEEELQRWNEQRAQALFFRGTYHFYLHSVFNNGKIIIRDKYDNNVNNRASELSTSEEVRAFFRKDLRDAIKYLPMPAKITQEGRISKGAATMVLANSYLYEGTDAAIIEATKLFESVRDDFGYTLETDISKMFTTAGEFNSESIFEINYTTDFGVEADEFDETSPHNRLASTMGHFTFGGQNFITPATWLALAYENDPINAADSRNTITVGDGTINTRRVSLRASAMIMLNDDLDTPVYDKPNALQGGGLRGNSLVFCAFKKYTNHDLGVKSEQSTPSLDRLKSGKNVTINRLSETLLNLAECYIKQNRLADAITEINKIRDRWALEWLDINSQIDNPGIPYDKNSLMERFMFVEKPLELSIEGHSTRAIDLRRWGIAQQRFQQLANINYKGVFYPRAGRRPINSDITRGPITALNNPSDIELFVGVLPSESEQTTQRIFQEFEGSAQNYNINNGYLPIPAEEIINNNKLNQ